MKRNIYIMYTIGLLQGMVFYGPIATLYRQAQGLSIFEITLIESISLLLCILLEIPWGIVADKLGYKKTMVFCSGLYFVSKIVFWQAESFGGFLLERIMLSVVIAGLSGVDTSVLYLSCKGEDSHRAFGVYSALQTLGLLAAALVFAVLVKEDYSFAALLTVLSYGLAAVLALFLKEVKGSEQRIDMHSFRHLLASILRDKKLLLFLLAVAFITESHQTITVFLNQLQYEKCGLGASAIGYIYIAVTILGLLAVFSKKMVERISLRRSTVFLFLGAALACLSLALSSSAFLSVASVMLLRICYSLFEPLQTELKNRQISSPHRATAMSIFAMIIDSVGIGTNLLFGALADRALPMAFAFGAVICLTGLIMFLIWHKAYLKN